MVVTRRKVIIVDPAVLTRKELTVPLALSGSAPEINATVLLVNDREAIGEAKVIAVSDSSYTIGEIKLYDQYKLVEV